jgi:hypothetical protein
MVMARGSRPAWARREQRSREPSSRRKARAPVNTFFASKLAQVYAAIPSDGVRESCANLSEQDGEKHDVFDLRLQISPVTRSISEDLLR